MRKLYNIDENTNETEDDNIDEDDTIDTTKLKNIDNKMITSLNKK